MNLEVLRNAEDVARRGAAVIADEAWRAVHARGRFLLATSGGDTPWRMLTRLAELPMPWPRVHLFQVDERVVEASDPARNLPRLLASLVHRVAIAPDHVHAMPVDDDDLDAGAASYAQSLRRVAGAPAVLDLIHLGLGADGHTASLFPGDAALDASDRDVAVTAPRRGYRRMTLTYPLISRARGILWIVTGAEKADVLARLRAGDGAIPAGRVPRTGALLLTDISATAFNG
ncbi:MAG: 6-phosphogluconolactonase [Gemmatimonadaceae bacterium]